MSSPTETKYNPFLSLAPTTSDSHPQMPTSNTRGTAQRRSSSVSSGTSGYKVLKLGPVHWGEHLDEHKEDFHEVEAEPTTSP